MHAVSLQRSDDVVVDVAVPIMPIEVQPLNDDKRAITDLSSAVHSSRNSTRRTSASHLKRFTFAVSFAIHTVDETKQLKN